MLLERKRFSLNKENNWEGINLDRGLLLCNEDLRRFYPLIREDATKIQVMLYNEPVFRSKLLQKLDEDHFELDKKHVNLDGGVIYFLESKKYHHVYVSVTEY